MKIVAVAGTMGKIRPVCMIAPVSPFTAMKTGALCMGATLR